MERPGNSTVSGPFALSGEGTPGTQMAQEWHISERVTGFARSDRTCLLTESEASHRGLDGIPERRQLSWDEG